VNNNVLLGVMKKRKFANPVLHAGINHRSAGKICLAGVNTFTL
jgi:hypothetical protein